MALITGRRSRKICQRTRQQNDKIGTGPTNKLRKFNNEDSSLCGNTKVSILPSERQEVFERVNKLNLTKNYLLSPSDIKKEK